MALEETLRERAMEMGLVGFGICAADPFPDTRRHLEEAVQSGRSARLTFTFSDPATATDPRRSFPWAESLVVAAHSYAAAAGDPGPGRAGMARVARFAVGDHYAPLRESLERLAGVLVDAGHRAEVLVDDNRLVDRAAAVRSGVAWWGKSTMTLVPGAGPWVLLGTIVTDAELPVSAPMRRDCGTCDACIPACPTGAIIAPGVLDARRCLAAIAQAPGSIPDEFRVVLGDRLYGCDDCLTACPPGHRAMRSASGPDGRVDLIGLLGSSDRTLRDRFDRFYIPRNDVRHLRRNALVALGNTGGPRSVGVLAGYAGHRDAMLREHAIWALGRLDDRRAAAVLEVVTPHTREAAGSGAPAGLGIPRC
ncbi:MAG TPA: tRNA epoxyqueuosine(34) reductase QueG [Acidimicrobiia bacterium]|nr:tRNA epoxyqueuosine(34) reductase QueG [Acidimicrobiia bacterium]